MEGKQEANEKIEGKRDYNKTLLPKSGKFDVQKRPGKLVESTRSQAVIIFLAASSSPGNSNQNSQTNNTPILDPAHAIPWIIKHLDEMKFLFSNVSLSCQRSYSAHIFLPGEMGPRTASLLGHRSCIVVES